MVDPPYLTYPELTDALFGVTFIFVLSSKMNERNRNRIKELEAKISDLKKKQVSSVLNY